MQNEFDGRYPVCCRKSIGFDVTNNSSLIHLCSREGVYPLVLCSRHEYNPTIITEREVKSATVYLVATNSNRIEVHVI